MLGFCGAFALLPRVNGLAACASFFGLRAARREDDDGFDAFGGCVALAGALPERAPFAGAGLTGDAPERLDALCGALGVVVVVRVAFAGDASERFDGAPAAALVTLRRCVPATVAVAAGTLLERS